MEIEDIEKAREFLHKIDGLNKLEKEINHSICYSECFWNNEERVSFKGKVSALLKEYRDSNMRKIEKL